MERVVGFVRQNCGRGKGVFKWGLRRVNVRSTVGSLKGHTRVRRGKVNEETSGVRRAKGGARDYALQKKKKGTIGITGNKNPV